MVGEMAVLFARKSVKHVQLSVHPPDGRISMVAPHGTREDVARAFALSKLGWIRDQQDKLQHQPRETPREYIQRESHYLWGRRYLLDIVEKEEKPSISVGHRKISLTVRPGSDSAKRSWVVHEWHKSLLHKEIPKLLEKWQRRVGVDVNGYYLRRMKTKWGSCNHHSGTIRLNTELVKKPKHLLEYVVVHELLHLLEPTHNDLFVELLSEHYPTWREAKLELNNLPLAVTKWRK